jgi:hypothetical protein
MAHSPNETEIQAPISLSRERALRRGYELLPLDTDEGPVLSAEDDPLNLRLALIFLLLVWMAMLRWVLP